MVHSTSAEAPGLPAFLYGTAWKEDRTQTLTELALEQGFRGIDTANQRKHYYEAAVGAAVSAAIAAGRVSRAQLFLQTKFTFERGQDHRLPYDPKADYATQVKQSFQSSLEHLNTDYLDSYLLHGPFGGTGLTRPDYEVWAAMEELCRSGRVRMLGVSNVNLPQLRLLCERAEIPPSLVQNRCYARSGWDREIRRFCRERSLRYQGFSLLTANQRELESAPVQRVVKRTGRPLPAVVFRFALDIGIWPLTGTSNAEHMRTDLQSLDLELSEAEKQTLESLDRPH
jgi:diketogulonate reductase-like aldo/keto reductase